MIEAIRWAERVFYVALTSLLISRMLPAIPHQPQVLFFLASELSGALFIIFQRRGHWSGEAYPFLIALVGTSAPFFAVPLGEALAPSIGAALLVTGACIALCGKLSLRRSFGLVPANRGVKTDGLYRWVRHPIYLGYVVSHVGLLLTYASFWNLAVLGFAWILMWLRSREEEKFLSRDPLYGQYAQLVRHRLVPGLL
jgi:protein-S-isoprenylcysteine O-methyltransferase Ste14